VTGSCCCTPEKDRRDTPEGTAAGPPAPAGTAPGPDVVWLAGGRSYCGTRQVVIRGDGEERREVRVGRFGIDRFAVTNRRFAAFVAMTGYRTEAEAFGWSFVFRDSLPEAVRAGAQQVPSVPWWYKIDGADWRRPAGPGSSIDDRMDHPVVHVSWRDADAFAKWAGGRLLSEAEWEFAARGGRDWTYPWGDGDPADDDPRCNIWQGVFPTRNLVADGFAATAPVDAFEPNGYGLYNMAGNCWEWCSEAFRVRSLAAAGKARDKAAREAGERLLKGGSFLCHRSYCHRYRIAGRMGRAPDTSTEHIGFRIGYDA
jgi:formylglycine-generating enzyme required for sulfatase activity